MTIYQNCKTIKEVGVCVMDDDEDNTRWVTVDVPTRKMRTYQGRVWTFKEFEKEPRFNMTRFKIKMKELV